MKNSLEDRIGRMEVAINQILTHLDLQEQINTTETNTTENSTEEPAPTYKNNKGKGKEPIDLLDEFEFPMVILESIIHSNADPKKKIEDLSKTFTKYHTDTELRIMHLENNVLALLAKFGQDSEIEIDHNIYQID